MIIPLVTRCTYDWSWKHDKMTLKFGDNWLRSMDDSDASNFFAKSILDGPAEKSKSSSVA